MTIASILVASMLVGLSTAGVAHAATVYTGDTIQGKRVVSQLDGEVSTVQRDAMVEPGTRVMQILHDSPKPECDGDGCAEPEGDYVE